MALLRVQGLVIRSRSYGEADRLLTLLTLEKGKISAIAKGVRKPTSRLKAGIQLFSHSHLMVHEGKNLHTVTQAEAIEAFYALQIDPDRFAHASYMAELVDKFTLEQGGSDLYPLLLTFWHLLTVYDIAMVTRLFELRFLDQLGYGPAFSACVICGNPLMEDLARLTQPYLYAPLRGGFIGNCCSNYERGKVDRDSEIIIAPNTVALLRYLRNMDPRQIGKLKAGIKTAKQARELLQETIKCRYEGRMRSWSVLEAIEVAEEGHNKEGKTSHGSIHNFRKNRSNP
ncbi:DNA repair protein RecO [Heliorestis acidaminivorans]|uniref:DNA repair protein RecO n=1 Tax=Heliorestis acidaminivorans TaxID=553427 RepID=A0A6I0F202_9FIRM|nr:DNA repair protein RecO [Heliorestis acidaminivorans]KAB2952276.1 DNA repair protein RecO [Heliorestis acidaminivorans]